MLRSGLRRAATFLLLMALAGGVAACGSGKSGADTARIAESIRRGDELAGKKQFVQAAAEYSAALTIDPSDAATQMKLALALREGERFAAALKAATRAADMLPNDPQAQRLGIWAMLSQQRFVDAHDRATTMLKSAPDDVELLLFTAHATARLQHSYSAIMKVMEAVEAGYFPDAARFHMRPAVTQAEDQIAERTFRRALALSPASTDTRLGLAGFLWTVGRWDEGTEILKKAADDDPRHALMNRALGVYLSARDRDADAEHYLKIAAGLEAESRLSLANFYARRKRNEDAFHIFDELAKADPDGPAPVRAADLELKLGRPAEALKRADTILAKTPNNPGALRVKAQAHLAAGDKVQSLSVANDALGVAPASRDAHLALAQALEANGDLTRAFDEYSEAWRGDLRDADVAKALARVALALGRHGIAVDLATQSLRLKPGDPAAAVILARGSVRLGDLDAADRALAPFATAKSLSSEMLALEGEILAGRGRVEPARAAFRKALQLDRDSIDALNGLVALEIKAGQAARIRAEIDQAAARHPADPRYMLLSARIALAQNDLPRAETALRAIVTRDNAHEDAALLIASILSRQGRANDAQAIIEKAIERRPASVPLRFTLAALFEQQGLVPNAKAQYERVVTDNQLAGGTTDMLQALHTAYAKLATLYANEGTNLDEALQLASSAKRYQPNDPIFSDALGWVHVKKLRARIGLPHLQEALKGAPGRALTHYHLGVAYEQLGDVPKARQELTEALRIDAGFPGAEAARILLKAIGR